MKPIKRQRLVATIFPASMLDVVQQRSQEHPEQKSDEIVFLTGVNPVTGRRVRMIAEAFVRNGKTIRVVHTL